MANGCSYRRTALSTLGKANANQAQTTRARPTIQTVTSARATNAPAAKKNPPMTALTFLPTISPRHDLSLAEMNIGELALVIDLWREQSLELGREYAWVQVFENKGDAMGCSNPHPHGQIWAQNLLPDEVEREDQNQRAYRAQHDQSLLLNYANRR